MGAQSGNVQKKSQSPRRRNTGQTVAALKAATRKQLISEGITGLSVQNILTQVDLSRGALFHHFPTKNHLIAAAFGDLLAESAARLGTLGAELRAGEITRAGFVEGVRDTFCSELFVGSMEVSISNRAEPVLRDLVEDAVETWWVSLSAFWKETFDLPERSPEDAEQHWVMAANLLRGHAFTSTYRSSPDSRAAFCASFEQMILAEAVIRPPTP